MGAAATASVWWTSSVPSAHADTQLLPMYCVPGVTSARCRGTFWESGKLYRKEDQGTVLSAAEYTDALTRLRELAKVIKGLKVSADEGEVDRVGQEAARARIEIRQVGENVVRSLAGDERIDNERRLLAIVRVLDDADIVSLRGAGSGGGSGSGGNVAPGFSALSILLERASIRFDDFLRECPLQPDEYAG